MQEIKNIVTWLKNWFYGKDEVYTKNETYTKNEVNTALGNKVNINQGSGASGKNIVVNSSGNVDVEEKVSCGSGLSFDGSVANKINHTNNITAQSSTVFKKFSFDGQGHITGTANIEANDLPNHMHSSDLIIQSSSLSNIGTNSNASQYQINNAIDTAIGNLQSIKAIEVVSTKPTASADTMNKLYIISENNKVNVYYTEQNGTGSSATYEWHKMDADILDELNINWSDIQGKPTNTSDFTNDGSDGTDTYVETGDLGDVAFSNSYTDLENIPSTFTPSSHTHDDRYYTEAEVDALNCGTFSELQTLLTNASSGDTIVLEKDYMNNGSESIINITKPLTIRGNGHVIDADNKSRIFELKPSANGCTITDIYFINGKGTGTQSGGAIYGGLNHTITNCVFNNNSVEYGGGAISIGKGVNISNCIFNNNSHNNQGNYQGGGAIMLNDDDFETITYGFITNCVFNNNSSTTGGGAIDGASADVYLVNCVFNNNTCGNNGGAIDLYAQSIVSDCSFIKNSSTNGGAIYIGYSANISNCKFEGNTATNGANVYSYTENLVIHNCHITSGLYHTVNKDYLQQGDAITSIELVPKGNDSSADAYNGVIRLYCGDEPSP